MRTLFVSYRVTDLERSLRFHTALGYGVLGRVEAGDGSRLVILKFPKETAASLELVHRPADGTVDVGSGVDHLAVQVDGLAGTLEALAGAQTRSPSQPRKSRARPSKNAPMSSQTVTVTVTVSRRARTPSAMASTAKADFLLTRPVEQPDTGRRCPRPPHDDLDLPRPHLDQTHPPEDTDVTEPDA